MEALMLRSSYGSSAEKWPEMVRDSLYFPRVLAA